ncbi:thiamine transporter 1 [Glossina fuscipes]|uniref:Thiamine transporter 1 n=1 Tax=Glossina fuscipes TaxID=7396 RepID=A0A8U0WBC8_9MUSC|nr:thiamine transporter 1 [Glossina fuscipes]
MQTWASISMLLCIFGFFRELRPSEPFVTEFLTSDFRNITSEQLNRLVYPFGTYAVFAQLVLVFLLTDMLRYKPIIILSACAGIALFAILLWTRKIWELLIGQIFYGTFMASEVAYYTYIYAKVEKEHYQIVTGHTRAAILSGRFLAGVLAQILISTESMNYRQLHYISFGLQVVSFFVSVTLPPVKQSVYFYRIEDKKDHGRELTISTDILHIHLFILAPSEPIKGTFAWRKAFKLLMKHAISGYTNATVIKWSIWWLLATAGQLQVISYAQILWKEIKGSESVYNGGVEAAATLLGAGGALAAGSMKFSCYKYAYNLIIIVGSLVMGSLLIISSIVEDVWLAYATYVLFCVIFYFVITSAGATIATQLCDDSFGLIFGINTFLALAAQSLLTLLVATDTLGFFLNLRSQYLIYGYYYISIFILYCLWDFVENFMRRRVN